MAHERKKSGFQSARVHWNSGLCFVHFSGMALAGFPSTGAIGVRAHLIGQPANQRATGRSDGATAEWGETPTEPPLAGSRSAAAARKLGLPVRPPACLKLAAKRLLVLAAAEVLRAKVSPPQPCREPFRLPFLAGRRLPQWCTPDSRLPPVCVCESPQRCAHTQTHRSKLNWAPSFFSSSSSLILFRGFGCRRRRRSFAAAARRQSPSSSLEFERGCQFQFGSPLRSSSNNEPTIQPASQPTSKRHHQPSDAPAPASIGGGGSSLFYDGLLIVSCEHQRTSQERPPPPTTTPTTTTATKEEEEKRLAGVSLLARA